MNHKVILYLIVINYSCQYLFSNQTNHNNLNHFIHYSLYQIRYFLYLNQPNKIMSSKD